MIFRRREDVRNFRIFAMYRKALPYRGHYAILCYHEIKFLPTRNSNFLRVAVTDNV